MRQFRHHLAGERVNQPGSRRCVVRLVDIDKVLVVGGDSAGARAGRHRRQRRACRAAHASADDVVERRVGETNISLAVEAHAVKLHLEMGVAAARRVEEQVRLFVHFDGATDLERRMGCQRCDQLSSQFVEIEVVPAGAFRLPDEPPAVLQEDHRRAVLDPSRRPLLADDHARGACLRIGSRELENALAAVGPIEQELLSVRRPCDPVHVMTDDVVGERHAGAHIDRRGLLRGEVVHEQIDDRIVDAGLRVRFDVDRALELHLFHRQVVIRHLALVETVIGQPAPIRRPPHRGPLRELLAVNPARGTVLRPVLRTAVRRHGDLRVGRHIDNVDVAVAMDGSQLLVG